jgi:hypothetical protein
VWAPGDGGFALPDFLGANLFGDDGFQGFTIEIHYDNPRKLLETLMCRLSTPFDSESAHIMVAAYMKDCCVM